MHGLLFEKASGTISAEKSVVKSVTSVTSVTSVLTVLDDGCKSAQILTQWSFDVHHRI